MLHYSQNKVIRYKGSNISIGKVILDVVGFIGKHFRPEMLSFFRRITEMGLGKLYTEEESCHFIWSLSETRWVKACAEKECNLSSLHTNYKAGEMLS